MMFPDRLLDHAGPGRPCATATVRMAFRHRDVVGARDEKTFAAQWLAYASPCRRFAADLAIDCARLGAGVVRTTFTVEDFHLILLAGLPAHPCLFPARLKKFPARLHREFFRRVLNSNIFSARILTISAESGKIPC